MVLAQMPDVVSRGSDFGPLGWVLSVLFLCLLGFGAWYAKYVALPNIQARRESERNESAAKVRLTEAVEKLCEVTGNTHKVVEKTNVDVTIMNINLRRVLLAKRCEVAAIHKLAVKAGIDVGQELAEIRGILAEFFDDPLTVSKAEKGFASDPHR